MCVYIYIYVCVCVCVYIYIYIYVGGYIYIYIYIYSVRVKTVLFRIYLCFLSKQYCLIKIYSRSDVKFHTGFYLCLTSETYTSV